MQSVYLLQHLHIRPDGDEDYRLVGVYGSRSGATGAMGKLRAMPGFRDFPELVSDVGELGPRPDGGSGFYLVEQVLDRSRFTDGFEFEVDTDPPDHAPIPLMTAGEQDTADALTIAELKAIDLAILTEAGPRWSKVARIVGNLMYGWPEFPKNIPAQLYVQRIERLAGRGDLESAGDLRRIRYSEVRLPGRLADGADDSPTS